jgi:hypothetical protein
MGRLISDARARAGHNNRAGLQGLSRGGIPSGSRCGITTPAADGIGFYDAAELAGDPTPTQVPVVEGWHRRTIDRILVNEPWKDAAVAGSYQVHQPTPGILILIICGSAWRSGYDPRIAAGDHGQRSAARWRALPGTARPS